MYASILVRPPHVPLPKPRSRSTELLGLGRRMILSPSTDVVNSSPGLSPKALRIFFEITICDFGFSFSTDSIFVA